MKIILSILLLVSSALAHPKFRPERIEITPTNQSKYEISVQISQLNKVTVNTPLTMEGGNLEAIILMRNWIEWHIPLAITKTDSQATTSFTIPTELMSQCDINIYYPNTKDNHDGIVYEINLHTYLEKIQRMEEVIDQSIANALDSLN